MNYGPASKYYDLFAAKDDIVFYKGLAVKHGRKALELGVGTGRVAIDLARAGVTVWGIDNSKYMLSVARQKLKKESPTVRRRLRLRFGDMRNFKLKETFPFVYVPSSAFEHCITEEDQRNCLTCVHSAMERKGILAFDISQPMNRKPGGSWWVDRKELGTEEEVVRTIFSRCDPRTNVVSVNLFFEYYRKGKLKEKYYEYGKARISSKREIEELLEDFGFRVDKVYGDFDKAPYAPEGRKAVFISSKP